MRYQYRAVNEQGLIRKGVLQASNQSDLDLRLARLGLTLIHAKAMRGDRLGRRRIGRPDLINFCFHLEQLTRAGVPLLEGLADLRDSLDQPHFREMIATVIEDIEGGRALSQALSLHPEVFDPVFINLIRAGELSGELALVLKNLTESIKWQDELLAQTRRILMYPAFVSMLVLGVLSFLLVYLVPQLVEFIKAMKQQIPLSTQILMWVADFFRHFWWILPGLVLAGGGLIHWRQKVDAHFRFRLDSWVLRLPAIGPIWHKIIMARFANVLALLYGAGIPLLDCIRATQGIVNNLALVGALQDVENRIRAGQGLSVSFEKAGLFPPLVLRMLRVGEGTGELDHALRNVSYFYDRDIKEAIARVQALIEPVMTVILGLILAWIMSSVLDPVFDMMGQLR